MHPFDNSLGSSANINWVGPLTMLSVLLAYRRESKHKSRAFTFHLVRVCRDIERCSASKVLKILRRWGPGEKPIATTLHRHCSQINSWLL